MASERQPYKFLGRTLGTGTGWDGDMGEAWTIFDFQPASGISLPETDALSVDEVAGEFQTYDDSGGVIQRWDIITTLHVIPRDPA